jgi:hypothetical protein
VLGGGPHQICGAVPTVQRSAIGSARLACSASGGSFLRTDLLQWSDLRACLGDRRCCSPEIGDAASLETGYAVAVWRSSSVVGLGSDDLRVEGRRCYGATGLGSGYP